MAKPEKINWTDKNVEFALFCPKHKGSLKNARCISISMPQKFLHDPAKVSEYGIKIFQKLVADVYGKTIIK